MYWKCTWSTSNNPGLNSTNTAASATGFGSSFVSSFVVRFTPRPRSFTATAHGRVATFAARNAPSAKTTSAAMTEHRWNTTHAKEAYGAAWTVSIAGSAIRAKTARNRSKCAKSGG